MLLRNWLFFLLLLLQFLFNLLERSDIVFLGEHEWSHLACLLGALISVVLQDLDALLVDQIEVLNMLLKLQYDVVAYRLCCPSLGFHFLNYTRVYVDVVMDAKEVPIEALPLPWLSKNHRDDQPIPVVFRVGDISILVQRW